MMKSRRGLAFLFVLAVTVAGCGTLTINKVLADPGK